MNQAGKGDSEPAVKLARVYIDLRRSSVPADALRSSLDRAGALAPQDDRVWLAKANLAIRTGSYDEAARWLDACLERRPDDAPVWRARLNWAVATNRLTEAREAMTHLPAAEFDSGPDRTVSRLARRPSRSSRVRATGDGTARRS